MSRSILNTVGFIAALILLLFFAGVQFVFEVYTRGQVIAINEAKRITIDLKNIHTADASFNDKSVFAQGHITTNEELVDSRFGVRTTNLGLIRSVEYYQWNRTSGRGTHYIKRWYTSPVDSTDFPEDKKNTAITHIDTVRQFTSNAHLGAYKVDPHLLGNLDNNTLSIQFSQAELDEMHETMLAQAQGSKPQADSMKEYYDDLANNRNPEKLVKVVGNYLFYGEDVNDPHIGDMRVQFLAVPMQKASLVGSVVNGTLGPFIDSHGESVEIIRPGTISMQKLLSDREDSHEILLWMMRILMTIFLAAGFSALGEPITRVCSGVPVIRTLYAIHPWLFAAVIAPIVSLLITGIAFMF